MKVQRSIDIAAPPEKIWPLLIEPNNILKWCMTFRKFEYTSEQHSGVGTTFYVEEKAAGLLMKLNFTVSEWVENERIAFYTISGTGVRSYEQSWTIKVVPPISIFTFVEQVELPFGIVGKLIGAVVRRSSERHVKKMLDKLKSLVVA